MFLENGRRPHKLLLMEDDLNFLLYMEDDLNFLLYMEDDLNFWVYGRRPLFLKMEDKMEYNRNFGLWKTTYFFCKWKTTSIF